VVAGTAADANRVAYVKTVRPSSMDADEQTDTLPPRYTNEVDYDDVSMPAVAPTD